MLIWHKDKEPSKYSKYKARTDLAKIGQVVSMLACLLGFCWGDCTCSCVPVLALRVFLDSASRELSQL